MKLLVDIGNTTIKFAILNYQKKIIIFLIISSKKLISEKKIRQKLLINLCKKKIILNDITLLVLSSVRPMWDNLFYKLTINLKIYFYQIKKNLSTNRLKIDINNPYNIGSDLIACSYAILNLFPKRNVLLINMGTATTISLIKKGVFLGTVIIPGLAIAAEALFKQTQLLQKFNFYYENVFLGKNTKQAINIGLVNGHLLMIKKFVSKFITKKTNLQIILTGGNAIYIKKIVNYYYDKYLLFKGLIFILQDNLKKNI